MSYEENVKAMHRFDASVKTYIGYLAAMDDQELQLCMARMADNFVNAANDGFRMNLEAKLALGEVYCKQVRPTRGMGEKLLDKGRRLLLLGEEKIYFKNQGKMKYLEAMKNHQLQVEDKNSKYQKIMHEYRKSLTKWESDKRQESFYSKLTGRLGSKPIEPTPPPKIPEPDKKSFIKESKKNGKFVDFLIGHTADYLLSDIPPLDEVKKKYGAEEIKLLSFERHNSDD